MNKLLLAVLVVGLTACATKSTFQRDSSAAIGCPSKMITITNERFAIGGIHTWQAVCKGKVFLCRSNGLDAVNCTMKLM